MIAMVGRVMHSGNRNKLALVSKSRLRKVPNVKDMAMTERFLKRRSNRRRR